MKTALILAAKYNDASIPLETVCEYYFGLSIHEARKRANKGTLPIPAFRLGDSQKSPWHIHVEDLAVLIDRVKEEARRDHVGVAA